jgi:hypothetical protein
LYSIDGEIAFIMKRRHSLAKSPRKASTKKSRVSEALITTSKNVGFSDLPLELVIIVIGRMDEVENVASIMSIERRTVIPSRDRLQTIIQKLPWCLFDASDRVAALLGEYKGLLLDKCKSKYYGVGGTTSIMIYRSLCGSPVTAIRESNPTIPPVLVNSHIFRPDLIIAVTPKTISKICLEDVEELSVDCSIESHEDDGDYNLHTYYDSE